MHHAVLYNAAAVYDLPKRAACAIQQLHLQDSNMANRVGSNRCYQWCVASCLYCLCRQAAEEVHVQTTEFFSYHKQSYTELDATTVINGV